jgi:hypothetical protein
MMPYDLFECQNLRDPEGEGNSLPKQRSEHCLVDDSLGLVDDSLAAKVPDVSSCHRRSKWARMMG